MTPIFVAALNDLFGKQFHPRNLIAASLAVLANGENSLIVNDDLKQVNFAGNSHREFDDRRSRSDRRESPAGRGAESE